MIKSMINLEKKRKKHTEVCHGMLSTQKAALSASCTGFTVNFASDYQGVA